MASQIDLFTLTCQELIPRIKSANPPKKGKILSLIEQEDLNEILGLESSLERIAREENGNLKDIVTLFKAKVVLVACEASQITIEQGRKTIQSLEYLKNEINNLDTASYIDDFISSLDITISSCDLDQLFEWARFIKSIPTGLGSHDTFIPILSVRLKSLIWASMPAETMDSHIELARTLLKCTAYKDLELNDIIEIIVDSCLDQIETTNDFYGIEKVQGNIIQPDLPKTSELLSIIKTIEVNNKELKTRLEELENKYGPVEKININHEIIRINEIKSLEEIKISDDTLYFHENLTKTFKTEIREAALKSGTKVAVKIYTATNQNDLARYKNEIDTLSLLSNQKRCFLQYYGQVRVNNKLYIITELCSKSLANDFSQRKTEKRPYTNEERISYMSELLEGFAFMTYKKKYHQDIKPQNIMISMQGIIKIIDFNVSIELENTETTSQVTGEHSIQGTKDWMSPELLEAYLTNVERNENAKLVYKLSRSDIFSLGLVFLTFYTFDSFSGLNSREKNRELLNFVADRIKDDQIRTLIGEMLSLDPRSRPSFKRALARLPGATTKAVA
jgi:Protein kinase domain